MLPDKRPLAFNEAYYENCQERESFNEPLLTMDEYWDIWIKMTEHKEARK